MSILRSAAGASCAIAALLSSLPARADMGLAPAKPGDVYVSGEGGFLKQDGGDVNAYGISFVPSTYVDQNISADNGWFAGVMVGYEKGSPLVTFLQLPFTRLEVYGYGGKTDDSVADSAPPLNDISIKSVDGSVNATGGTSAEATTERRMWEIGYRSEVDQVIDATRTITWGLVSFIRGSDEETDVICTNICTIQRSADVDTLMFGSMLVMEPEWRFAPGVALVGRLGVGYYTYDIDGKFRSSPGLLTAYVKDSDDGIGFRAAFGAGLKFVVTADAFLETFAEADYFSDVGTARFSNSDLVDGTPSGITTEDMWELRVGGRLTFKLDNANN